MKSECMKYVKFVKIALSMLESESVGHFRTSFPDVDDKALDAVWKLKDNPVLGISEVANSTLSEISRRYIVPLRSLQNWSSGERQCPNYVWILLAYAVFSDLNILEERKRADTGGNNG